MIGFALKIGRLKAHRRKRKQQKAKIENKIKTIHKRLSLAEAYHLKNLENRKHHKELNKTQFKKDYLGYEIAKKRKELDKEIKNYNEIHKKDLFGERIRREIFKNPMSIILDKKQFCKERKERRKEIMRKTSGKGLKIRNAKHTIISKIIRCEHV